VLEHAAHTLVLDDLYSLPTTVTSKLLDASAGSDLGALEEVHKRVCNYRRVLHEVYNNEARLVVDKRTFLSLNVDVCIGPHTSLCTTSMKHIAGRILGRNTCLLADAP
jgi:hypothetical protein